MKHVLPPLPYDLAALEPHIDARTMALHHDQHHASYVANALASSSAMSSRGAVIFDANEAARRLRQAEHEREQGVQRLPGKQAHGADANVANRRYWQRQEELRRVVEQAQRRSGETGRALP